MAVAAITGVLAARGKQVDLFGVIVLALVTAFGGGTVRDLALGLGPVFWVRDPNYLINGAVTAVVWFAAARLYTFPAAVLLVADAFVLAFFTVVGARTAMAQQAGASIVIAMGVITGVVGGIIRDMLTGEIPLVFRRQIYLYATASFAGALALVWLERWLPTPGQRNAIVAMSLILLLRLAAIRWKLHLPEFEAKADADDRNLGGQTPR